MSVTDTLVVILCLLFLWLLVEFARWQDEDNRRRDERLLERQLRQRDEFIEYLTFTKGGN